MRKLGLEDDGRETEVDPPDGEDERVEDGCGCAQVSSCTLDVDRKAGEEEGDEPKMRQIEMTKRWLGSLRMVEAAR